MISRVFCALLSISWCVSAGASNFYKDESFPFIRSIEEYKDIFERNIKNDPNSKIDRGEEKKEKPIQSKEKKGDSSKDSPPDSPKNEGIISYDTDKEEALYFLRSEGLTVEKYIKYAKRYKNLNDLGEVGIPKNWQQNSIDIKIPMSNNQTGKYHIPLTIKYNTECGKAVFIKYPFTVESTLKSMPLLNKYLKETKKYFSEEIARCIEAECSLVKYVFTTHEPSKSSKIFTTFMKSSTTLTSSEILEYCKNQGHCTYDWIEKIAKHIGSNDSFQILNYFFTKEVFFENKNIWNNVPLKFLINEEENIKWMKVKKNRKGILNGLVDSEGKMLKEIFENITSFLDIETFLNLRFISKNFSNLTGQFQINGILDLDKAYLGITDEKLKIKDEKKECFKEFLTKIKFFGIKGSFGIKSIKASKMWEDTTEYGIKKLTQMCNEIDDHDTEKLEFFLSVAKVFENVKFLYLQGPLITDDVLSKFIKDYKNIKTLILDSAKIKKLMTSLGHVKTLESLSLANRWLCSEEEYYPKNPNEELNNQLVQFINNNPELKEVDLSSRAYITDEVVKKITEKNKNITYLNLASGINFTKNILNLIKNDLKNIQYLDIDDHSEIKTFGTKEEISKLIPTLKFLNLKSDINYLNDM